MFFVLPGTGDRHDLTATPSNNLLQDSDFHRFVAISAYSRPTTCEIQEMPNHLCIIMRERGFLYEGYYVSLPGTVLGQLEEAEEAAEFSPSAWGVLDLE